MSWFRTLVAISIIACAHSAYAQRPQGYTQQRTAPQYDTRYESHQSGTSRGDHRHDSHRDESRRSTLVADLTRWVQAFANDLDHLEEEIYYERGKFPRGLRGKIDQLSGEVAHFQHVLRGRNVEMQHLRQDFRDMDEQIHDVLNTLKRSEDRWLQRQASRLSYSHEQMHYTIERNAGQVSRELLVRHARLLEDQATALEDLADRVNLRDSNLHDAIHDFADETAHFQDVVDDGRDNRHLREDFEELDESWHLITDRLNRSSYGYYLRNAAQNVNRVHNQLHEILNIDEHQTAEPVSTRPAPPAPTLEQRRRTAIEFEIPGLGRFQIQ